MERYHVLEETEGDRGVLSPVCRDTGATERPVQLACSDPELPRGTTEPQLVKV